MITMSKFDEWLYWSEQWTQGQASQKQTDTNIKYKTSWFKKKKKMRFEAG